MATPTKSIGLFEITYGNGVVQKRHLIPQSDYDAWHNENRATLRLHAAGLNQQAKLQELKASHLVLFGDTHSYFTTDSPVGKAMETGFMMVGDRETQSFTRLDISFAPIPAIPLTAPLATAFAQAPETAL